MIESPLIQEIVAEALHRAILKLLRRRFGDVPVDLETRIQSVLDEDRLTELNGVAGSCASLDAFRQSL
ncbi:MAG: DUF4351 domain-containing protein [Planctomycetes bacterium]|nr:DUF4351 domain-containing protein [Planctomycetota bacterium]